MLMRSRRRRRSRRGRSRRGAAAARPAVSQHRQHRDGPDDVAQRRAQGDPREAETGQRSDTVEDAPGQRHVEDGHAAQDAQAGARVAGAGQAGNARRLDHLEDEQGEQRAEVGHREVGGRPLQAQDAHQGRHSRQAERAAQQADDHGQQERLVHDPHGAAAVAGADEVGDEGRAAHRDEDGVTAEEPGEVIGGRLGRLAGHLVGSVEVLEAPGQQPVGQADDEDEELLEEDRPGQPQHELPGRELHRRAWGGGRGAWTHRWLHVPRLALHVGGQPVIVHSGPPAIPKRSPARSLRPG